MYLYFISGQPPPDELHIYYLSLSKTISKMCAISANYIMNSSHFPLFLWVIRELNGKFTELNKTRKGIFLLSPYFKQ